MTSMLVIFFVEFGSSRYLSRIDEKVMALQLRESGSHNTVVEPLSSFLARRKVVINGKQVAISAALAGEAAQQAAETFIRENGVAESMVEDEDDVVIDEEAALLDHPNGVRKTRRCSHSGHHHFEPPPRDAGSCPGISDVTRKSQLLAVGIMEGGLCFHSIFVGMTLAVSQGGGFVSLLTAIMFHRIYSFLEVLLITETFEGMGLGARIATLSFPSRSLRPYLMGMAFAIVTPIGMAIGLSIRTLYSPTSHAALITTGVFDAISSGLLIYASLVELLAHEFLMGDMRYARVEKAIFAGICIIAGAVAMSLLGLWV
jgi:hypothetical protein